MLKAVIFDMDGVIVDSELMHYRSMQETLKKYGVSFSQQYYSQFPGNTSQHAWETIIRDFSIDATVEQLYAEDAVNRRIFTDMSGFAEVPGALSCVERMHSKYLVAIASGSPMNDILEVIDYFKIHDMMSALVSGEEIERCKPAPDIFLIAADMLGVSPDECAVIEDSRNGVIAAKAAGMYCVGLINPNSGNQDLSSSDKVVHSMNEIVL